MSILNIYLLLTLKYCYFSYILLLLLNVTAVGLPLGVAEGARAGDVEGAVYQECVGLHACVYYSHQA